jgi:hypothetical protein
MGVTGVTVETRKIGELGPGTGNKGDGKIGWAGGGDNGRGAGDG